MVIVSGVRTPIGSQRGVLSQVSAPELGAAAIEGALIRGGEIFLVNNCHDYIFLGIPKHVIDQVIMGNVLSAGVGQAPARQAAILANLPKSVVCTTVNKVCSSGMKAVSMGCQSIVLGESQWAVAGGMESMSNVPYYVTRGVSQLGHQSMKDGIIGDGLTDPFSNLLMGEITEKMNDKYNITREMQDNYAKLSIERTAQSWINGLFNAQVVPVSIKTKKETLMISEDEEYKKWDPIALPSLRTVFRKDGTITAGNASKVNDGAAALVLTTLAEIEKLNKTLELEFNEKYSKDIASTKCDLYNPIIPIAKVLAWADAELDPLDFPIAPSMVIEKVLGKVNLHPDAIDLWEMNEAFSSIVLLNMKLLNEKYDTSSLTTARVNIQGGAVALGHPIGMSGARIILALMHALKKGQKGCAAVCNGGGGASAFIIEKLV